MEREKQMKNSNYQNDYFEKRADAYKKFGQNERVYQYYQELERQKKMKDMELESRFVDEAAFKMKMMDD